MEYYVIYNNRNKTQYIKQFGSSTEPRDWIISNLDMTINWTYDRLLYLIESGNIKSVEFYK